MSSAPFALTMSAEDADDIEAEIERLKADSRTRDGFARVLASLADVQEMGFNGVRQHVHAPVGARNIHRITRGGCCLFYAYAVPVGTSIYVLGFCPEDEYLGQYARMAQRMTRIP
jgi:hypothetical protein